MTGIEVNTKKLPSEWIRVKLSQIANILYGQGLPQSKFTENGFPVFGANGIIGYYDEYLYENEKLLISCRGANSGKINISPKRCYITNNSLIVDFPVYEEQFRKIFFYALQLADKSNLVSGSAQPQVTINNAVELDIPLPPFHEQRQIVYCIEELFSELDSGIESLKKARELLKTYRQAVLKHAFEGKLTQEWRARQATAGSPPEPAENLIERIRKEREAHDKQQLEAWEKECEQAKAEGKKKPAKPKKPKDLPQLTEEELAELPDLPEGWKWSYLSYFGWWTGGGTPAKKKKEYWVNGSIPWISPKDMKGQYIKSAKDKITSTAVSESSAKFVEKGSVLFVVRSGILRRILPVSITTELSAVNQDLQAFTPYLVLPEYIYWYTVCNEFYIRHSCAKSGTTVESIETTSLKNYRVPLSPIEEQKAIVAEIESRLSVCDQLEQSIEDSLEKAESLRQSILKKAFSGDLTQQWREENPELISGENSAERLLERIQAEKKKAGENGKNRAGKKKKTT